MLGMDYFSRRLTWRLFKEEDKLYVRVLKAKYGNLRRVDSGRKFAAYTHIWCSILIGYEIVQKCWEWTIRDERKYRFWLDPYLESHKLMDIVVRLVPQEEWNRIFKEEAHDE